MPRTKKNAAEEVVVTAAVEAVETAAAEAAPVEKVKKPRATKAKKPAAEKKADVPKATRAKKAKVNTKVVVELMDKSASSDTLIERAKEDWAAKGNSVDDIKELALYINATESMVYYVVNDDYLSGSFAF